MIKEKSCGCIAIYDGKVLMIKHNKGHWSFPKGHVENNETEIETAIREVKEETNIDVIPNEKYRYVETYKTDFDSIKDVIYFIAKPTSFKIKNQEEEVSKAEFVKIEDAINLITYDNTRELFKKALNDINYKF